MSNNYDEFVRSRLKSSEEILTSLTPEKAQLVHLAMLLASEAGEMVDSIKKHVIYEKDIDMLNVIEEMGDIEFALSAIRLQLNLDRDFVLAANEAKLKRRYPTKFSNADAAARADKQPESGGGPWIQTIGRSNRS